MEHFKNKNEAPLLTVRRAGSGAGGPAARIVGPVAVEADNAPFHALLEAGEAAILDDRIVHGVHARIAQLDAAAAVASRNVVGLPGPEGDFVDVAVTRDGQ